MRISDWSSDVCSSDLLQCRRQRSAASCRGARPMTVLQRRYLKLAVGAALGVVIAVAIVGLLEQLGVGQRVDGFAGGGASPSAAPQKSVAVMTLHYAPSGLPEVRFTDSGGQTLNLGAFRGQMIPLNILAHLFGLRRGAM